MYMILRLYMWCGLYLASFHVLYVCFFNQKTAYEMRMSDWSSDVCSSDLQSPELTRNAPPATISDFISGASLGNAFEPVLRRRKPTVESVFAALAQELGRASSRERVCQYV